MIILWFVVIYTCFNNNANCKVPPKTKKAAKINDITSVLEETFLTSVLQQDAMAHIFLIIGEAAGQNSAEMRSSHPEIPWRVISWNA